MTTFEITIIVLLTAIVVLLIVLLRTSIEGFHGVWQNQQCLYNLLNNADDANRKFYLTLNDYLSDLAVNVKGNYNTLEQQQDDIGYIRTRINHILGLMHPAHEVVTPCYAPNGICTNPQMDCINCPKRGTGGTWSTGTNINKEDKK